MKIEMKKGFTLIELLIVIAIIVILAGIALVAINPGRQYQLSRDAKRQADINAVLSALNQYQIDHNGTITDLGTANTCPTMSNIGTSDFDLSTTLPPEYLAELPIDPDNSCNPTDTCYDVCVNAAGRITVDAPNTETKAMIRVTR